MFWVIFFIILSPWILIQIGSAGVRADKRNARNQRTANLAGSLADEWEALARQVEQSNEVWREFDQNA